MQTHNIVDRFIEERAARHGADAGFSRQLLAEVDVALALLEVRGDVGQHEVRALGIGEGDADVAHALGEDLFHVRVVRAELVIVAQRHVEADDGGLHQRRRAADGVEVVVLADARHDVLRRDGIAESPAGDGVGLGERRAGDRALPHAGDAVHVDVLAAVVDDVLIHLVHDGVNVVADAEVGDGLELFLGEDLAARVRGIADDDGLRAAAERIFEHVRVKGERRRIQRDKDRLAVGHDDLCAVVFEERGEHHDAVARIRQGEERVDHRFGRADGRDDLGLGVDGAAHEVTAFARDGLAEIRRTHRDGVLMGTFVAHDLEAVHHLLGRVQIGEALR